MDTIIDKRVRRVLKKSDTPDNGRGHGSATQMPANARALTYRECEPPTALKDVVDCLWRRESWRPPHLGLGVLPDGCVDLIWASDRRVLVIGPQSRSLTRPLPADVVVVGVRFPPGIGPSLFGVSARELVNLHVPLDAVDTRPATSLLRELVRVEDDAVASGAIVQAVARRVHSRWSPDLVVQHASALLEHPKARVARVADALGISERQLQRRFRNAVGYGPKTLQRIVRFQRLLTALGRDGGEPRGLAWIAPTLGYSDQAHLINETRALSGLSPGHLAYALGTLKEDGALGIFKTGGPPERAP